MKQRCLIGGYINYCSRCVVGAISRCVSERGMLKWCRCVIRAIGRCVCDEVMHKWGRYVVWAISRCVSDKVTHKWTRCVIRAMSRCVSDEVTHRSRCVVDGIMNESLEWRLESFMDDERARGGDRHMVTSWLSRTHMGLLNFSDVLLYLPASLFTPEDLTVYIYFSYPLSVNAVVELQCYVRHYK